MVDTIVAVSRPLIPLMFISSDTIRALSGPVTTGGPVSVIIDDIDSDGKKDIAFTGADGKVRYCKGNDTVFSDPVTVHSGPTGKTYFALC